MKRKITLFIATTALLGAVLVSAALGDNSAASSQRPSKGARVALGKTTLGKVLVDARGRTLYLFEKDKGPRSTCSGACASAWPPVTTTGAPTAGMGVAAAQLKTTMAPGGKQVLYAGHPLYTYVGDSGPGQTTGEGLNQFGAEWYVLGANGGKIEKGGS